MCIKCIEPPLSPKKIPSPLYAASNMATTKGVSPSHGPKENLLAYVTEYRLIPPLVLDKASDPSKGESQPSLQSSTNHAVKKWFKWLVLYYGNNSKLELKAMNDFNK